MEDEKELADLIDEAVDRYGTPTEPAEKLFSIPGIGSLIVDRITYKDEPVIIAGTILISVCFTVVMLLVDLIYAYIDPRIRAKYARVKG